MTAIHHAPFLLLVRRAASIWRPSRPVLDGEGVRQLCMSLLADVSGADREAVVERLTTMRRAEDVQHLRGALFDVISHVRGEATARERIGELDRRMHLPRVRAPGEHGPARTKERRAGTI